MFFLWFWCANDSKIMHPFSLFPWYFVTIASTTTSCAAIAVRSAGQDVCNFYVSLHFRIFFGKRIEVKLFIIRRSFFLSREMFWLHIGRLQILSITDHKNKKKISRVTNIADITSRVTNNKNFFSSRWHVSWYFKCGSDG